MKCVFEWTFVIKSLNESRPINDWFDAQFSTFSQLLLSFVFFSALLWIGNPTGLETFYRLVMCNIHRSLDVVLRLCQKPVEKSFIMWQHAYFVSKNLVFYSNFTSGEEKTPKKCRSAKSKRISCIIISIDSFDNVLTLETRVFGAIHAVQHKKILSICDFRTFMRLQKENKWTQTHMKVEYCSETLASVHDLQNGWDQLCLLRIK